MLSPLTPDKVHNLRLSGQVISVGRSSLEIAVKMESIHSPGHDETLLIGELIYFLGTWTALMNLAGRFSMVCRDAKTHKARPVNPLVLEDSDDQALVAMGDGVLRPG